MRGSSYGGGIGHTIGALLSSAVFALAATQPALAQIAPPTPPPAPSAAADGDQLGDIIVTAQRRSERLQDVPISITAADATALAEQRVFNVANIASVSPSISFRATNLCPRRPTSRFAASARSVTRGRSKAVSACSSTACTARGRVKRSTTFSTSGRSRFCGPQGTLFGKNTSAGALLLTSTAPSTTAVGGRFEASYGNYNAYRVSAALNLPLSDTVAIRVAALQTDHDGYVRNVNGGRLNEQRDQAVKARVRRGGAALPDRAGGLWRAGARFSV